MNYLPIAYINCQTHYKGKENCIWITSFDAKKNQLFFSIQSTQPVLINCPKTQLSGLYVAESEIYGTSGTTWFSRTDAMYLWIKHEFNREFLDKNLQI